MTTLTLPCECGRPVTADPADPTRGVREHNATPEHQKLPSRSLEVITLLGPCPCTRCGEPLRWNGWAWQDERGLRHRCAA